MFQIWQKLMYFQGYVTDEKKRENKVLGNGILSLPNFYFMNIFMVYTVIIINKYVNNNNLLAALF